MSAWTQSNEQRDRERFWRTPPPDPTRAFKKSGTPYYRPGKNRVLMPDDFMPFGPHAGKHLRAVPTDYLLWVNAQTWAKAWPHWQPIADYLDRFPIDTSDSEYVVHASACPDLSANTPLFYLSLTRQLYTLPGHEDLLQTFAEAVLNQRPCHYQTGAPPHYQITSNQAKRALKNAPIQQVTFRQRAEHRDLWIQFFQTKPKLPQP